ncbi:MAG: hypothetical protein IPO16_00160 [Saprospiraceae bacterium]|nr:hypothetical protein [Saprospiraceae bacterium]
MSSALIIGNKYKLSFYILGNTTFSDSIGSLLIGESNSSANFGIVIDSVHPIAMTWKEINLEFTAQQNSSFITVKNEVGINAWNQVDSFAISEITGTDEFDNRKIEFTFSPNPTELLDLSTGYYIVQVITDEGMASKLLIKNKD